MYIYQYKISYYDGFLEKACYNSGKIAAGTYTAACERLIEFYGGEEYIYNIWIEVLDEIVEDEVATNHE